MEVNKRCISCKYKIQKYNIKISDNHDAFNNEYSTYQKAEKKESGRERCEVAITEDKRK